MARSDRPRTSQRATYAVLVAGCIAYGLVQSMVGPVLPILQRELHTSENTVTWVMTSYLLSASVCTPILGRVGDRVGKERMLVVALGSLAAGAVVAALATSIGVMIAGRVLQGAGGAVLPLTFGIIRDEFPRERVAGAVGTAASLIAVGGGTGILIAGPVVDLLDYHWIFWLPAIAIALMAVLAHVLVPESPVRSEGKVGLLGGLLLTGWLVALLVGVSQGSQWGWTSGRVLGLFAVAVVVVVAWVAAESRSASPLVDMRMMRIPAVWTSNLVAFLVGVALYAGLAFLPQFFQTPRSAGYGFGASVTMSGVILLPNTVLGLFAGLSTARLATRFSFKAVLVTGSLLGALSFLGMAFAHGTEWPVYVYMGLFGLGIGLAFAALSAVVVDAVPAHQTGVAGGMNANIRTVGGAVGSAVAGSVVTASVMRDGFPTEHGYTVAFAGMGVICLLSAAASLLIPTGRTAHQDEPETAGPVDLDHLSLARRSPGG